MKAPELSPERMQEKPEIRSFAELSRFICTAKLEDLNQAASELAENIPELKPLLGFDQRSPHHAYDLYTHVAHVVAGVPEEPELRWAALLHDVGKIPTFTRDETGRGHFYGHAAAGGDMADAILRRLEAPEPLRQRVVFLIRNHMTKLEPEREFLKRALEAFGPEALEQLLLLQEADMGSKGTGPLPEMEQFARIRQVWNHIE